MVDIKSIIQTLYDKWVKRQNSEKYIFVSYAHEDEQSVNTLINDLKQQGFDLWFAPLEIEPGREISIEVKNAIDHADFFILAVTEYTKNSSWVASEVSYALELEKEGKLKRLIPVYLTSRDAPKSVADHLAIDLRYHVYTAGFNQLVGLLKGSLPPGQTPLNEFELFIKSAVVAEDVVMEAIDSVIGSRRMMGKARYDLSELTRMAKTKTDEEIVHDAQKTMLREQNYYTATLIKLEKIMTEKNMSDRDKSRIIEAIKSGKRPTAFKKKEMDEVFAWLRIGDPIARAMASWLYSARFITSPVLRVFSRDIIVHQVRAWVKRGEVPEDEGPDPDLLIRHMLEQKLIRPLRSEDRLGQRGIDLYKEGPWFRSVGKAAYLFETHDPRRPPGDSLVGRYPGSSIS